MKLKKVVKTEEELKHEENVRRGKKSKRKGGNYERTVAQWFKERYHLDLKRTPQSGGFAKKSDKAEDYRGDISLVDSTKKLLLHIECKDQKTWKLKEWLSQAEEDCPEDRVPLVVFHQHCSSKNYVCLSLEDFLKLVEIDKVVTKRKFK